MPDEPDNTVPADNPLPPESTEHEPLEDWLNQRVRPLPPPPGTFELITRRARRRKLRQVTATAASGAVVAAAVLVATTNPTLLRLRPPAESGQAVAGARPPATASPPAGTQMPNGSGRLLPSPPAPSSPAGSQRPYPGPVPADFAPSSVTFVSPTQAWAIGQAGVPGACYNGNICTSVAWTSDGGRVWHGEHAPVAGAPSGPNGVSGIRFLNGADGWAFGPELWATHDGGNSWHAVDTFGQRVTDLETAGGRAYALFADCSGTSGNGFAAGCGRYTLMTATADGDGWAPVGPETSNLGDGTDTGAVLALAGGNGYLLAPDGTVYSGPLGGAWARAGTAPCKPGAAQASGLPSDAMLAAVRPGHLALACTGSSSSVFTSGDGGATWTRSPAGTPPAGEPTSLAAAPDGTLVLATTRGIDVLGSAASQWHGASGASGSLPAGGFSYVGMTTSSQGVALPASTSLHEIWVTSDGGRTWTPRPVSA